MSLVVALEGSEGLILASDSRGTIGDPRGLTAINDNVKKLFKLNKYAGIGIVGSSELAANVIDELIKTVNTEQIPYVNGIVQKAYNLTKNRYKQWFGERQWVTPQPLHDSRPTLVFTLVGYEKGSSLVPRIYLLNSQLDFVPQLCPSGYMLTGVPQYATYLLHRLYDRRMTIKNLSSLAAYLIMETSTQDPKVGGPVHITQITPNSYTELDENNIEEINKRNEEQNLKLRNFFFEGGENGE